jgi:hypothetical protein
MEKEQINNVFRILQGGIHREKNSSLDFCKIGKFGNKNNSHNSFNHSLHVAQRNVYV